MKGKHSTPDFRSKENLALRVWEGMILRPLRVLCRPRHVWALLSGLLLFAAFPPMGWKDLAWVALAPLLIAAGSGKIGLRAAALLGWCGGMVFWAASIFWLSRVTLFGCLLLSAYCAIYTIPICVFTAAWARQRGFAHYAGNIVYLLLGSVVWCGSEFLRAIFGTGFNWNLLGVSQYRNVALVQCADLGGTLLVSLLLILVNLAVAATVLRYRASRQRTSGWTHPELMLAVIAVAAAFSYGVLRFNAFEKQPAAAPYRVALIQTNISQYDKWTAEFVEMMNTHLEAQTREAQEATPAPQLVVWPETALPDILRFSNPSNNLVLRLCEKGIPLLVGALDMKLGADGLPDAYYNSSFLFDGAGELVDEYDKQHLVMFGEYIPFGEYLPFGLQAMTPIQENITPGSEAVVFRMPDAPPFSVLICFEDTVPTLSRTFVKAGARLLVNQTNDAWFDPYRGNRQHLAQAVFRAVENRVPMLRCANTGVTCHIDPLGRVREVLTQEGSRSLEFQGQLHCSVHPPLEEHFELTFYTRYGDWLGWSCLLMTGLIFLGMYRSGLGGTR